MNPNTEDQTPQRSLSDPLAQPVVPSLKTQQKAELAHGLTGDPEQDEKYARALLQAAQIKYDMEAAAKGPQKPVISKRKIIFLIFIIISTLISLFTAPLLLKSSSPSSNTDSTTKQLIDDEKYINDVSK